MPERFDDKVIVITGAASGIGKATAFKLASLGATLCLCDINGPLLTEVSKEIHSLTNKPPLTSTFNIGSETDCSNFIKEITTTHTQINHVFNCAGINPTTLPTTSIPSSYWDRLISTNLTGLFLITRLCIPHMPPGSTFVNVSSIAGLRPTAGFAVYCATKYGIIGFSKCLALELGGKGIRTNVVAPGYIDTPTNAMVVEGREAVDRVVERVSMGRLGRAEEVADVVVFLMGGESGYVNGSVVEVNGGC